MSSSTRTDLKPLLVHSTPGGANPMKVLIILEELNLPYTIEVTSFANIKNPAFIALNPNGRAPALTDPNTSLTLWESGAIIQYLIATYDTAHTLTHGPSTQQHHLENQWLQFQMSGQGPYYGQAMWFAKFHPEDVPSAKERYLKEVIRVQGVLDGWLAKEEGREYLVGNKCTYADLAFVPWDHLTTLILEAQGKGADWEVMQKDAPNWWKWTRRLLEREPVKRAIAKADDLYTQSLATST